MVATTKVTTARVQSIKLGEYDQVFALTQKMINDALEQKFLSLPEESPLKGVIETDEHVNGAISGEVGAPRVMVLAPYDKDLSGVNYIMYFTDGLCRLDWKESAPQQPGQEEATKKKFNVSKKATSQSKEYEMKDWCIAFHLMLGMTEVERTSDHFKKVVPDALHGKYKLNELVAKFDTAEYDETNCKFGKYDWNNEPKGAKNSFAVLIKDQKDKLLKMFNETGTIGYALENVETSETTSPALTFEPCGIQYQTYPWVPPEADASYAPQSGLMGNSKLNYLLYAEVTKDAKGIARPLPNWNERYLNKRMGNWTDGRIEKSPGQEASDYGAFHMSRVNFFEGYLLPKLKLLNSTLDPTLTFVNVRIDGAADPTSYWNMDLKFGDLRGRAATDSYYDFKPVSGKRTEWEYTSNSQKKTSEAQTSILLGSSKVKFEAEVSCKNTIQFEPGSDIITVSGSTRFKSLMYYYDKVTGEDAYEMTMNKDWEVTWGITLDLEAVTDGGIQIATTFTGPDLIRHKDECFNWGLNIFVQELPYTLSTGIRRAVNNTKGIQADLAADLAGQQGLCLPAKGVFCFKNPILGHDGDLICSIEYVTDVTPKQMLDPNNNVTVNRNVQKERIKPPPFEPKPPKDDWTEQIVDHSLINMIMRQKRDDPNAGACVTDSPGSGWWGNIPDNDD